MRKDTFGNIFLYILMVFLCVGLGVLIFLNVEANKTQADEIAQAEALAAATPEPAPTATPEPTPEPARNTETTTLAFAGDLVAQEGLVSDAKRESTDTADDGTEVTSVSYDFSQLLTHVKDALSGVSLAACSLDGVMEDADEYPSYQCPTSLASALKDAGFSLVNTATDNALTFGLEGLNSTLSALDGAGLAHTGTYASQESRDASSGVQFMDVNNIRVAFLGYTYGTNGVSAADNSWCVNILTTDYMTDQVTVDYDRIASDLAAAKSGGANLIVCYIYWWDNTQYYTTATPEQAAVVDYLCQNGVDIVMGGGVKTPQPIEVRPVDRDGKTVNCLICTSLGNLASCLNDIYTDLSAIVYVDVQRDVDRGDVWISAVRYKPLFMLSTANYTDITDAPFRYRILSLQGALDDFAGGNTEGDCLTDEVNTALTEGLDQLRGILGASYDEANGGVALDAPAIS